MATSSEREGEYEGERKRERGRGLGGDLTSANQRSFDSQANWSSLRPNSMVVTAVI